MFQGRRTQPLFLVFMQLGKTASLYLPLALEFMEKGVRGRRKLLCLYPSLVRRETLVRRTQWKQTFRRV